MNKVWCSPTYSTCTMLKLFHSSVLTTLLYGSECWCLMEKDLSKLSTFHTKSLQDVLCMFWRDIISNKDLFEWCGTEPMATILMRRCWRSIGHATHQEASIVKTGAATRSHGNWTVEKNQGHGEDLGRHQAYGKGLAGRCERSTFLSYIPLRHKGH